MALYPSVQKRVQNEIDGVVGTDRLPTYEDRPSLPIVEAVVRETLRWRPVLPLAVPHTAVKDDIYKGYYIPKGKLTSRPNYQYPCSLFFRDNCDGELVVGFKLCEGHLVHFDVLRAVSQDETVYEKANSFYPERFLNLDGTLINDKVEYAFGYGRRYISFAGHVLLFVTHYLK